jgi:hypothetical protein
MSEETKPNYGSNENKIYDIMSDIIGQENKAVGGRIGFQEGGTDRELELLKFYLDEGLDLEAAQDMVKSALAGEKLAKGGRVGLQNGGEAEEIPTKSEYQIALERPKRNSRCFTKRLYIRSTKVTGHRSAARDLRTRTCKLIKNAHSSRWTRRCLWIILT